MLYVNGLLGGSCCLTFLNVATLLSIGHHTHPILANYLMETFHLENVEYAKDLGITIDSHLKFHHATLLHSHIAVKQQDVRYYC